LKASRIEKTALSGIIYCTISPDNNFPGSAAMLLRELDLSQGLPVYEVRNHCAGFITGLMIASSLIGSGAWQHALVIGAELQSTGLNLSTAGRNTAVLFGDGAGAAVMGPGEGILDLMLGSDGSYAGKLGVVAPTFVRTPAMLATDFAGLDPNAYPRMDGRLVFKMASQVMPKLVRDITEKNGVSVADLTLIIPHQANQRILDMLGHELGCPDKVFSNIGKYGNTTAATIPIALSEAVQQGRIKQGDLVCLVTFGAGFAWGAALVRW
jgi:3-oxoacyl-[acyl-carrier-protein] synthase-3